MTTQMKFDASARHEMTAQPPFRAGDYELHVFKAPGACRKSAAADDVFFASVGPVLGAGLERDDASLFKGPEERADDARYAAEHSGRDVYVVAYDLNTDIQPVTFETTHTAETKIFKLGAYEAHVHYPAGCAHKTLMPQNVRVYDAGGLIGTEDHEMDNTMDADDRAAEARSVFAAMKKDGAAKAVAFFVGRLGVDEPLHVKTLTTQMNRAAGTPTLEDRLATLANTKLAEKPAAVSWVKRVLGLGGSHTGPLAA